MSSVSRCVTKSNALDPEKPLRYRTFAPPVTSRPSRCADDIPSASAAIRRGRRSVMHGQMRHETAERELVPEHAEPAYDAYRGVGQHRVTPLGLSGVDVRDVDFHERQRDSRKRVTQREARVRVRTGIHERALHAPAHRVDAFDQLSLA